MEAIDDTNKTKVEVLLKLYQINIESIHKYSTIIWQVPTAIVTLTFICINYFKDDPALLIILPFFNFALLIALFKHVSIQQALVKSVKAIEMQLCSYFDEGCISNFQIKNSLLRRSSARLIGYTLIFMNVTLLFFLLIKIF